MCPKRRPESSGNSVPLKAAWFCRRAWKHQFTLQASTRNFQSTTKHANTKLPRSSDSRFVPLVQRRNGHIFFCEDSARKRSKKSFKNRAACQQCNWSPRLERVSLVLVTSSLLGLWVQFALPSNGWARYFFREVPRGRASGAELGIF